MSLLGMHIPIRRMRITSIVTDFGTKAFSL
ncbi:MAG: hypothetical protein JWP47_2671 [Polaromonas sp.]|nr:hypothetical protein [Polaromonas sp.]